MAPRALTYKQAGVNIDAADEFIEKITPFVKTTDRPEVMSSIGHYAGLFSLTKGLCREPVLVASTDGVGTKVKLASEWDLLEGLGQDLVAMSANDILCLGAQPLFFLDYFATGRLDVPKATILLKGIAVACREIGCALLGGETAEMPNIYRGKDFDLAGFVVGVVERGEIIDGAKVRPGDRILGLSSSGIHSNGFSLVRKIVARKKLLPNKVYPGLNRPLREVLLAPTRLYVRNILKLKESFSLRGIAHITGGGLLENLPRVFPENCRGILRLASWPRPGVFQCLQRWGHISEEEMQRVFNCGIGLALIVPSNEVHSALAALKALGEEAWEIGEIVARKNGEPSIEIL